MDRANAARIQEWDARPLTGGYRGLRELSDANFSGAVTTGTAWLFMLNGRIVGLVDGTMASFESAEATAHLAPDPALPLLFAMKERGGETQAKYYSDDNPLPEVHQTLEDASFTGYVELSDNVLSGDYYVVYYGGKSMSAAFVGNAERLVTGDKAFRQAADEVGIYEVKAVDLDVREVPEPEESADASGAAAGQQDGAGGTGGAGAEPEPAADQAGEAVQEAEGADAAGSEPAAPGDAAADPAAPQEAAGDQGPSGTADAPSQPSPSSAAPQPSAAGGTPDGPADESGDPFSQEAEWRETRTIPALDPEETDAAEEATADAGGGGAAQSAEPAAEAASAQPDATPEGAEDGSRVSLLEHAVESQSETIEELQAERSRLESELEGRGGAGAAGGAPAGRALDPETALDQTDLFVRYGTKGGGTLEKAHDGALDREEVVENLRIEYHTRFEADQVTIGGQPFEAFLESTVEYRYVEWVVTKLLFEILDTGNQRALRDLFDAIPLVDRAEFRGAITADGDDDEQHEVTFDVVCRDRMGQPLVVANINDLRDPATGEMMTGLIDGASAIGATEETLGGAFMVTSSFFQPDALETAAEATGGGLLGREKRRSYVKLGRKRGYHLCLVEARGDDFHMAVPEL